MTGRSTKVLKEPTHLDARYAAVTATVVVMYHLLTSVSAPGLQFGGSATTNIRFYRTIIYRFTLEIEEKNFSEQPIL